ncbi:MAG: GNAT family N-acetyltransferase [Pelagimonas sp.]|nr:GNAT family N-acetyltransferase [Pelagimonas sp.]
MAAISLLSRPDLPHVVPLLRALHSVYVAALPDQFHDSASSGGLLAYLQQREEAGAWFLGLTPAPGGDEIGLTGYLMVSPLITPRDAFSLPRRGVLLEHIYLMPNARGQGYGAALLHAMEAQMVLRGDLFWEVSHHAFDRTAAGFFAHMGAGEAMIRRARRL